MVLHRATFVTSNTLNETQLYFFFSSLPKREIPCQHHALSLVRETPGEKDFNAYIVWQAQNAMIQYYYYYYDCEHVT